MNEQTIDKLNQPLDSKRIKTREGVFGSYLESHDVIRTANEIFGYGGWGVSDVDLKLIGDEPVEKEGRTGVRVAYRATVRVRVGETSYEDVGYGDAVEYGSVLNPHSLASKQAVSDAVKRCLRNFGDQFGLGLYDKDAPTNNQTPKQKQDEKEVLAGLQGMTGLYPEDPGDFVITFGKHKGSKLSNIPKPYISWLANKFEAKDEYGTAVVANARKMFNQDEPEPQWSNAEDVPF